MMKVIKGIYSLIFFLVTRAYQLSQIRFERTLYKSKYFRSRAGYE